MSENGIILIGPIGAGKSTIGELLSKRLNMPQCSMDKYRWGYYEEMGYDHEYAQRLEKDEGFTGVYRYWKGFEIYAVERILNEHKNSVIDFGAGHSVYENNVYLDRAKKALSPFKNVVLLLPSSDKEHSLNVLNKRNNFESEEDINLNKHFIDHKSNYELAKHIVYTDGSEPEDTALEVLTRLKIR